MTKVPTIKLNDYGDNSTRFPFTLSFHSASRLCHSLSEWKVEIDGSREDEHYKGLVYGTINTESRILEDWCIEQNRTQGTDYFDCLIEPLQELQKVTQDLAIEAHNLSVSMVMQSIEQADPEDHEHIEFLQQWLDREQDALGAMRRQL